MNDKSIQTARHLAQQRLVVPHNPSPGETAYTGHTYFEKCAFSRRAFLKTAAGAAGVLLGAGLPQAARAGGSGEPKPIPGGFEAGGQLFHVLGPGIFGTPADAEPSSITDFNGFIGLTFVDGIVTRTNTTTGEVRRLPFLASDMRFMKGVFRDTQGRVRQGAFAFV
jgi:hypothetical protein